MRGSEVPSLLRASMSAPAVQNPGMTSRARQKRAPYQLWTKPFSRFYTAPGPRAPFAPTRSSLPSTEKLAATSVKKTAACPKRPPVQKWTHEPSPPKTGGNPTTQTTMAKDLTQFRFLKKREFGTASGGTVGNPHAIKNHSCSCERFTPRRASALLRERIRTLTGMLTF